jgi:hypothetical protein
MGDVVPNTSPIGSYVQHQPNYYLSAENGKVATIADMKVNTDPQNVTPQLSIKGLFSGFSALASQTADSHIHYITDIEACGDFKPMVQPAVALEPLPGDLGLGADNSSSTAIAQDDGIQSTDGTIGADSTDPTQNTYPDAQASDQTQGTDTSTAPGVSQDSSAWRPPPVSKRDVKQTSPEVAGSRAAIDPLLTMYLNQVKGGQIEPHQERTPGTRGRPANKPYRPPHRGNPNPKQNHGPRPERGVRNNPWNKQSERGQSISGYRSPRRGSNGRVSGGTTNRGKPGNRPGSRPGNNPGSRPGNNPSSRPGNNPGSRPGNNPGSRPKNNPGSRPGNIPSSRPGNNPNSRPGNNPSSRPGNNPGNRQGGRQNQGGERSPSGGPGGRSPQDGSKAGSGGGSRLGKERGGSGGGTSSSRGDGRNNPESGRKEGGREGGREGGGGRGSGGRARGG